jgi:hypothetical protein
VSMIVLNYPHFRPSLEPRPLRAAEVWSLGEAARRQCFGPVPRPKIEVGRLIARARHLQVNGVSFETHWELDRAVTDDTGEPVMGAVEHDESCPLAAMISLNGELIGGDDDLARSTAAHELGHAVFDVPTWIRRASQPRLPLGFAPQRRFQAAAPAEAPGAGTDWREWRANEFMGAFLAPRGLLHRHMHKRAVALGVPLSAGDGPELPIVNGRKAGFDRIETLAIDLAELFGVSIQFIHVRLRKYGLISGS